MLTARKSSARRTRLAAFAFPCVLASALLLAPAVTASAAPVFWTDWQSSGANVVNGQLAINGATIAVTFAGPYSFAQTNGGTNYWNPSAPYISGVVDNPPPASDIIALNLGGLKSIVFSQPVRDPLIALVSWNGNRVDFGVPIEILSFGRGFWGNGTPILNDAGTGFFGNGEVHGVIRLPGVFTSVTFRDTSENWHGLTVGAVGLPHDDIPEPASLVLLGLGALGLASRRRR
jgi:hypothetical protein